MANKFKNLVWNTDIETYFEIIELGLKHGKKEGDNLQAEFEEILKKRLDNNKEKQEI
ncbi:MAG: hypothetical protein ACE5D6_09865 [Candidatus Zixiibacteriota bacterium]